MWKEHQTALRYCVVREVGDRVWLNSSPCEARGWAGATSTALSLLQTLICGKALQAPSWLTLNRAEGSALPWAVCSAANSCHNPAGLRGVEATTHLKKKPNILSVPKAPLVGSGPTKCFSGTILTPSTDATKRVLREPWAGLTHESEHSRSRRQGRQLSAERS